MQERNERKREAGYSLKRKKLKKWIRQSGYPQAYIAKRMGMTSRELNRRLWRHERFNQRELKALIGLMRAKAAFYVIYFPSKRMRREVYRRVFGERQGGKEI